MNRPGSTRRFTSHVTCLLAVVVAAAAGCSSLRSSLPASEDVAAEKRERREEVARHFDEGRDFAEFHAAENAWRQGDSSGAIKRLKQVVRRNPDNVDAQLLLAELLLVEQRLDEAIESLAPVAEAHPENDVVQHTMDVLLDTVGEEAEPEWMEEATARGGAGYGEIRQTSAVDSGEAFLEDSANAPLPSFLEPGAASGGRNGRREVSDRAGSTNAAPEDDLLREAAEALAAGDVASARACFQKAVSRNPHDLQIPISAAVVSLRYDRPALAIGLLEPLSEPAAHSAAYWRVLAAAHYRGGDFEASQTALEQALSLDKSSALAYFLMGSTLSKLGQPEAAETHFRQAERLDPRYAVRR